MTAGAIGAVGAGLALANPIPAPAILVGTAVAAGAATTTGLAGQAYLNKKYMQDKLMKDL